MTNSGWEDEDELQTPTVEEQNFPDSKVSSTLPGKVFLTNIPCKVSSTDLPCKVSLK